METGAYSEAIGLLYRTLLRNLRKATKQSMSTPEEIAEYFIAKDPAMKQRDLLETLIRIDNYLARPKILPESLFMRYMIFIRDLIDRVPKVR